MGSSSSTRASTGDRPQQPPLRSWATALPPAADGTMSGNFEAPRFVMRVNNGIGLFGQQARPHQGVNQAPRRPPRKTQANAVKNPVNLHKGSLHLVACERQGDADSGESEQ
jgi:hypothetical protein